MNQSIDQPGFGRGVVIALLLSALAGFLYTAGTLIFAPLASVRLIVSLTACLYIVYLLWASTVRTGRMVVIAAWLIVTVVLWLWSPGLAGYIAVQAVMVWLVRALYFHRRLTGSVLDLALVMAGVAAALWAGLHTGSLFMACWSFLLVQAGFVFIPGIARAARPKGAGEHTSEAFERAHRQAESALRHLSRDLPLKPIE